MHSYDLYCISFSWYLKSRKLLPYSGGLEGTFSALLVFSMMVGLCCLQCLNFLLLWYSLYLCVLEWVESVLEPELELIYATLLSRTYDSV